MNPEDNEDVNTEASKDLQTVAPVLRQITGAAFEQTIPEDSTKNDRKRLDGKYKDCSEENVVGVMLRHLSENPFDNDCNAALEGTLHVETPEANDSDDD